MNNMPPVNNMPPGWAALLKRWGVADKEEHKKSAENISLVVSRGNETVVDIKKSSNIAKLQYNDEDKVLTTIFKQGGVAVYENVTPEEFSRVAFPGAEFEYSVGKAHHALIVKAGKQLGRREHS